LLLLLPENQKFVGAETPAAKANGKNDCQMAETETRLDLSLLTRLIFFLLVFFLLVFFLLVFFLLVFFLLVFFLLVFFLLIYTLLIYTLLIYTLYVRLLLTRLLLTRLVAIGRCRDNLASGFERIL